MEQGDLVSVIGGLSVTATRCEVADLGTVDCAQICRCDDGSDYAIKNGAAVASMPHSEWFCTRLGELAGLASPVCKVVNVEGEACFGSRWETGNSPKDWWLRAKAKEIDFDLLAPTISRIFAFDLFVHNVDRHLTNYIVRQQHFGIAILAFDYSRAWLCNGFPPVALPMTADTNTMKSIRYLIQEFGHFIDLIEVNKVLDNLGHISSTVVTNILLEHPDNWLTKEQKLAIDRWWKSPQRLERLEQIKEGIKNGFHL